MEGSWGSGNELQTDWAGSRAVPKIDFREIIMLNVRNLYFFGFIKPQCQTRLMQVLWFVWATSFVGIGYVAFIISEVVNMYLVSNNLEKLTEASFLAMTHLIQTIKVYHLVRYYGRVHNLIESINRPEFQPKNYYQYDVLEGYIKLSKIIAIVFLAMCVMTCSLWGLFPYLDKDDLKLPLAGWYPFRTDYTPAFELTYTYQVIFAAVNGLSNISIDTLMSGLIMVICAQLEILNDSIQQIGQKTNEVNTRETDKHCTNEVQDLVNCIDHHRCILEFAAEFDFLFNIPIFGQFIVSVVIICITLFQISLVPVASLQFLSMILYQSCMLMEIFFHCHFGNEALYTSMEISNAAYNCHWMEKSEEFKRNLKFFMMRAQVPLRLYAGGYFPLSLETFVTIVKRSYSFFAVLSHMNSI